MTLPPYYARLSAMMFMQFGVYGLWLPIATKFLTADPITEGGLGFSENQGAIIVAVAAALGAIGSPLIVQFADRRFRAQRFLGLLMIAGGILKLCVYPQTTFAAWLLLSVAFAVLFMPAAAIANALPMRHLSDPPRQFPLVRMWTAIAWVTVGWTFSFVVLKTDAQPQWLPPFFEGEEVPMAAAEMRKSVLWSGCLAIGYGIWAFIFLPDTPPLKANADGTPRPAITKAFGMLRQPSFFILLTVSLVISAVHVLYFMQCGKFLGRAGLDNSHILPAMALGQFSEMLMYVVLAKMLPKLGYRVIIGVGICAFAVRFFLFGSVGLPLAFMVAGQALHGLCYAFFFSACFIYVDRVAPKDIRNSAQSLYNFVFYGIGPIFAMGLNWLLVKMFMREEDTLTLQEFSKYWYALGGITVVALIIFLVAFRVAPENTDDGETPAS
jgi:MFS family permease